MRRGSGGEGEGEGKKARNGMRVSAPVLSFSSLRVVFT